MTMNFPEILYGILANENNANYIHWVDDGTRFLIVDKEAFTSVILDKYFNKNTFKTFLSNLYHYGFTTITRDNTVTISHPDFQQYTFNLTPFLKRRELNRKKTQERNRRYAQERKRLLVQGELQERDELNKQILRLQAENNKLKEKINKMTSIQDKQSNLLREVKYVSEFLYGGLNRIESEHPELFGAENPTSAVSTENDADSEETISIDNLQEN